MEAVPNLHDSAVKKLAKNTPALKELSICKCQRLTTIALGSVAMGCPQLQGLNINYDIHCVPLAVPGVEWPPTELSKLLKINLRGCLNLTPDLFENLLKTCADLELLVTPTHITDVDLNCIGHCCPNLKSLDMSYSYYPTDNGVESVATRCPQIKHFNLEGCVVLLPFCWLACAVWMLRDDCVPR